MVSPSIVAFSGVVEKRTGRVLLVEGRRTRNGDQNTCRDAIREERTNERRVLGWERGMERSKIRGDDRGMRLRREKSWKT